MTRVTNTTSGSSSDSAQRFRWLLWVLLLLLLGWIAILVIPYFSTHPTPQRVACAVHLQSIGKACLTYADAHPSHECPPTLELLTQGGLHAYLQERQLRCPTSHQLYIYAPLVMGVHDPAMILAYEPLSNHNNLGANVLRFDGSVRWITPREYPRIMGQIQQQQKLAGTPQASQPTSSRPASPGLPESPPRR